MKILQKFRKVLQSKEPLLIISQFLDLGFLEMTKDGVSKPLIGFMQHTSLRVTTILLFLCVSSAFSQTTAKLTRLVPPSPTAVSLGRYGDVPISYYTGTANLNIPLHTIKTENHELDISLSYSTTGLKPGEEASWVGFGWALNAGGVITRTVRGGDDLRPFTGYWGWGQCLPKNNANNDYDNISTSPQQQQLDVEKFINMSNGTEDGEPDIFYYNAGPHAGKFVLDKNPANCSTGTGGVLMAQRNNLDIVYDNSGDYFNSRWVITDGNGYKYTFSQQETTVNCSQVTPLDMITSRQDVWDDNGDNIIDYFYNLRPNSYSTRPTRQNIWSSTMQDVNNAYGIVTSWYLTSIVSPQGETITLTYKNNPYKSSNNYYAYIGGSIASTISTSEEHYKQMYQINNCLGMSGQEANIQYSFQNHYTAYLEKITFNGGSIVFNNTTAMANQDEMYRDDLLYNTNSYYSDSRPRKLRNIEVRDDKDVLQKRFVFSYDYFNKDYNPTFYTGTKEENLRLRLDNVVEYGNDGLTAKKPYQFTYNDPNGVLPSKASLDLDGWGYSNYKGYNSNVTLLSNYDFTNQADGKPVRCTGGIRTPSTDKNTLLGGTLKEVVYPTGGKTTFDYELQTYEANDGTTATGGGLRVLSVSTNDGVSAPLVKTYQYTKNGVSSGSTSGLLLCTPYFFGEFRYNFTGVSPSISHCMDNVCNPLISFTPTCSGTSVYLYRSSNSLSQPGFSANGAIVGYSKVTEVRGTNTEGGTTEYNYRNAKDVLSSLPGTPNLSASDNGLLNSVFYKDNIGNTKRHIINAYDEKESRSIKGVYVKTCRAFSYGTSIMFKFYDNPSKWYALRSKTETDFINGATQVTKTTTYTYANAVHKEVTSEAVTQSDGTVLTTKYKRIPDYNTSSFTASSVYDAMNKSHMISPVIEQQTYITRGITNKILSGSLLDYKLVAGNSTSLGPIVTSLGTNPTIMVPGTAYEFHVSQPQACTTATCTEFESSISGSTLSKNSNYEPRQTYDTYDKRGNLVQYTQDGFATSLLWGYTSSLPIAKALNASSTGDVSVASQIAYNGYEPGTLTGEPGWEAITVGSVMSKATEPANVLAGKYAYKMAVPAAGYTSYSSILNLYPNPQKGRYKMGCWVKTAAGFVEGLATIEMYAIKRNTAYAKYPINTINAARFVIPNTNDKWQYFEVVFDFDAVKALVQPNEELSIRCYTASRSTTPVYIDEVRICPIDAQMTTLTHEPLVGPTSIIHPINSAEVYEYDVLGRVKLVKNHEGSILKSFSYKYKGQ